MKYFRSCLRFSFTLVVLMISGLADPAAKEKLRITVTVDDGQLKGRGEGVTGAWLGYAMARANWISDHVQPGTTLADTYSRSFEEEVTGRETLITVWKELKEKDSKLVDQYLDGLQSVVTAGFGREYVWTYLRGEGWKTKPPDLRLEEFDRWMQSNWPKHHLETCADASIDKKGGK